MCFGGLTPKHDRAGSLRCETRRGYKTLCLLVLPGHAVTGGRCAWWVDVEMRGGVSVFHCCCSRDPGVPALFRLFLCGCDKKVSFHAPPLAVGYLERGLPGGLSTACLPVTDAAYGWPWGGEAQSLGHLLALTQRLLSRLWGLWVPFHETDWNEGCADLRGKQRGADVDESVLWCSGLCWPCLNRWSLCPGLCGTCWTGRWSTQRRCGRRLTP